jgi:hypothetical protein
VRRCATPWPLAMHARLSEACPRGVYCQPLRNVQGSRPIERRRVAGDERSEPPARNGGWSASDPRVLATASGAVFAGLGRITQMVFQDGKSQRPSAPRGCMASANAKTQPSTFRSRLQLALMPHSSAVDIAGQVRIPRENQIRFIENLGLTERHCSVDRVRARLTSRCLIAAASPRPSLPNWLDPPLLRRPDPA